MFRVFRRDSKTRSETKPSLVCGVDVGPQASFRV